MKGINPTKTEVMDERCGRRKDMLLPHTFDKFDLDFRQQYGLLPTTSFIHHLILCWKDASYLMVNVLHIYLFEP